VPVTVLLEKSEREALAGIAASRDQSSSNIVCEMVLRYVERHKSKDGE